MNLNNLLLSNKVLDVNGGSLSTRGAAIEKEIIGERVIPYILSRSNRDLAGLDGKIIAGHWGIKETHLNEEFKRQHKITLDYFILREKLYRAFQFIERDHEVSAVDLSKMLGFINTDYFVQEFRDLFLIEPDRYICLKKGRQGRLNTKAV